MTRHVMLNNIAHKDLRVITRYGAEFGDNVGTMMVVPTEFADVQREYPIFFRKDPATGDFSSFALLGFSKDENLFLEDGVWKAAYVPGIIARGPFLIGFQERREGGDVQKEAVIHVDLDDPRISATEGEPVFLPQGGNSRYLDRVAGILNGIRTGLEVSKAMFAAFTAADLIEPVKIEVKFNSEEQYDLLGTAHDQPEEAGRARCGNPSQAQSVRVPAGRIPGDFLAGQRAAAHRDEGPTPPASGREARRRPPRVPRDGSNRR